MGNIGFFNAEEVTPVGEYGVMPEGEYTLVTTDSEVKAPKNGNGEMLAVTFEVVEGEFKGRKVWERFTLKNSNEKAVQIGRGKLSALCRATGVLQLTDSQQLHGKPFRAKVKVRPGEGEYKERNEVSSYVAKSVAVSLPSAPGAAVTSSEDDIPEWLKNVGNAPAEAK